MLYNTNKILDSNVYLTKEMILNKVSEYDIFAKYLGPIRIGTAYNSPLREEKNPSFAIFVSNRDNALLYRDMSTGECGDVFKFVKRLYNYSRYSEVLAQINRDMSLEIKSTTLENKREYKISETDISILRQNMKENDVRFWSDFGVSINTLNKYRVSSVSQYFVNGLPKKKYSQEDPIYAYKVFNKFKIYRPLAAKANKWRSNLSSLDIQGAEQLQKSGDLLIITKSLKDVMVLSELGYNAIAPASESTIIPVIAMDNFKKRFKKIIIFYDRDKTGVSFARKMVKKYAIDFMFINKKYNQKDISDFVKSNSIEKAAELIANMINK